MLESTDFLL